MSAEQDKAHIACAHCFSENRVPANRLDQNPKCGRCGSPLLAGQPVALDEAHFDAFLKPDGLPVVVDFWAPWCGPCRQMAPAFEQVAQRMATQARFAKVNTDEAQQLAGRYGIRSMPTMILFLGGREVRRISGAMDARSMMQWIQAA